jgi:ATP synthase I chain
MAMPAPAPLMPRVPLSLRRPAIIVAAIGVVALAASWAIGRPALGAFIILGMAMGLLNIKLVQRSVAKVTAEDHPSKGQIAVSSASRLLVITAVALVIAFLVQPDGVGVFFGLAAFQAILVFSTTVPVVKGLRQRS